MTLRIGDTAPDFTIESTAGPIAFHDWIGDAWCFFFSHPADFTSVCTTEMGRTAQLAEQFEARNTRPLGLSSDSVEDHSKWIRDINQTQNTLLKFPIVADTEHKVAQLYDMIHPNVSCSAAIRTVFIIDPLKKIRLMMTYPMNVGRNFDETLRVIDALQLADQHGIATPADWEKGDDVIIPPGLSTEDAQKKFPQGWNEVRPYLRFTRVA